MRSKDYQQMNNAELSNWVFGRFSTFDENNAEDTLEMADAVECLMSRGESYWDKYVGFYLQLQLHWMAQLNEQGGWTDVPKPLAQARINHLRKASALLPPELKVEQALERLQHYYL